MQIKQKNNTAEKAVKSEMKYISTQFDFINIYYVNETEYESC